MFGFVFMYIAHMIEQIKESFQDVWKKEDFVFKYIKLSMHFIYLFIFNFLS